MGFAKLSLKGRALKLLSAREHSRAELEKKLAPHEEAPGELAQALDELQARGFISEARVVESVLHRRAARLGTGRVRQELQAKGISPEAVDEAVQALRATEFERASEVWRRRFGAAPADPGERARQARFLVARGFAADTVAKVLRAAQEQDAPGV